MSENQKFYEEFLRNFNLTTPTPLLALEYNIPVTIQTTTRIPISTEIQYTSDVPNPTFDLKKLEMEGLSLTDWAFVLDAVIPALVFLAFYMFRVMCFVVYKIVKLKAKHPSAPISQTIYYSVFTTAIVGKHIFL